MQADASFNARYKTNIGSCDAAAANGKDDERASGYFAWPDDKSGITAWNGVHDRERKRKWRSVRNFCERRQSGIRRSGGRGSARPQLVLDAANAIAIDR